VSVDSANIHILLIDNPSPPILKVDLILGQNSFVVVILFSCLTTSLCSIFQFKKSDFLLSLSIRMIDIMISFGSPENMVFIIESNTLFTLVKDLKENSNLFKRGWSSLRNLVIK